MSKISRFTSKVVQLAKNAVGERGEAVTPFGGGDFASLAADKGYDWMQLREKLRKEGVRPLIKHREFRPIDTANE